MMLHPSRRSAVMVLVVIPLFTHLLVPPHPWCCRWCVTPGVSGGPSGPGAQLQDMSGGNTQGEEGGAQVFSIRSQEVGVCYMASL
jgi:hypothetical protein